jgi:LPPG:FO 2-phospho-L-lactate transferase
VARKILAVSGGVGGAKLVLGLAQVLSPDELVICANTADDFSHVGLRICPDLDTVMYTLAGISNQQQGWGLQGESWQFMASLKQLGGPDWFQLGDRDLATHVVRSEMLGRGLGLGEITRTLCHRLGVEYPLLPMSDDPVATLLNTDEGELSFQDYFVRRQCEPAVRAYRFAGVERARPQKQIMELLAGRALDAVVICPSNPFVSVAPVLELGGLRQAMQHCAAPAIAVSPIVGGRALKGPAAKMLKELDMPVSALSVAAFYQGLVDGFVIDECDREQVDAIEKLGMRCLVTSTIMNNLQHKQELAQQLLTFADRLNDA